MNRLIFAIATLNLLSAAPVLADPSDVDVRQAQREEHNNPPPALDASPTDPAAVALSTAVGATLGGVAAASGALVLTGIGGAALAASQTSAASSLDWAFFGAAFAFGAVAAPLPLFGTFIGAAAGTIVQTWDAPDGVWLPMTGAVALTTAGGLVAGAVVGTWIAAAVLASGLGFATSRSSSLGNAVAFTAAGSAIVLGMGIAVTAGALGAAGGAAGAGFFVQQFGE